MCTIGENNIGAPRMLNNFWRPIKLFIISNIAIAILDFYLLFSIYRFYIFSLAKVVALNALFFRIAFVYISSWLLFSVTPLIVFALRTIVKVIAKGKVKLFTIFLKSEKETTIANAIVWKEKEKHKGIAFKKRIKELIQKKEKSVNFTKRSLLLSQYW